MQQACVLFRLCFLCVGDVFLAQSGSVQIITASLFENPAISFFASFVTFCNLDPGIIVPVTSY